MLHSILGQTGRPGLRLSCRAAFRAGLRPAESAAVNLQRRCLLAAPAALWLHSPADAAPPPPLLLARQWQVGSDPSGWLVSEKFDGVRAIWDGQRLRFRSGRLIDAPDDFIRRLPAQPLDGELWLGHGRFDELSGLVRRGAGAGSGTGPQPDLHSPGRAGLPPATWHDIHYQLFELPGAAGTFAQRAQALAQIVRQSSASSGWPALHAVPQTPVADARALQQRLDAVVRAGGEGLMLHRADAPWQTGRSDVLRKFKPQDDGEATVIGHLPGRGALAGQTGALQVRDDQGRVFDLGSGLSAVQRQAPPAVGERVTFTHRGITNHGLPRFATFMRLAPVF